MELLELRFLAFQSSACVVCFGHNNRRTAFSSATIDTPHSGANRVPNTMRIVVVLCAVVLLWELTIVTRSKLLTTPCRTSASHAGLEVPAHGCFNIHIACDLNETMASTNTGSPSTMYRPSYSSWFSLRKRVLLTSVDQPEIRFQRTSVLSREANQTRPPPTEASAFSRASSSISADAYVARAKGGRSCVDPEGESRSTKPPNKRPFSS